MSLTLPLSNTLSLTSPRVVRADRGDAAPALQSPGPVCMDSIELLRGQKAVEIIHNGATYRLQATRLGKLILTK
ncbi:MAG: hypothetical protein JWQ72_816 [Polaromonas sp.]|nr:hypothetical protein [Polaromonas sp.]